MAGPSTGRNGPTASAYASIGRVVNAEPWAYDRRAAWSAMTAATRSLPWPIPTTIAPPAASMYSRPSASTMVASWASTATGGSGISARRNTRPARGSTRSSGTSRSLARRSTPAWNGYDVSGVGRTVASMEGRPLDEAELIERTRRGDVMAYETLVRRYADLAIRTAVVVGAAPDEAEDAAQDAFVKAYAALARFRPGAAFRPWLLRIVANEARNRRRSAGRRTSLALRAAEDRPSGDAAPSPEQAVLDHERRLVLTDALAALRDEDRQVIGARYLLDLSEAESALLLGIPRGTVKSRLSRALGRLRVVLAEAER